MNCPHCSNPIPDGTSFCEFCGRNLTQTASVQTQTAVAPGKPENVLTGIVGALIGAVIGGVSILLLSQIGLVASVSGLILAVCTLKGYELLGHRQSTTGIIISIVLMLLTPYIADRIDWAFLVMDTYDMTFGEAFSMVPMLIDMEAIELGKYILNLVLLYIFVIVGALGTLRDLFKKQNKSSQ